MGFIFLLFCYFLYCVLSFCYHFLLLPGERVSFFFILLLLSFLKIRFLVRFLLFEGRKGA
jgi:hypothetical protein